MSCAVPSCRTNKSIDKISLHLFPDPTREPERHRKWINVINSEKILSRDPISVFKQFRVCRLHFAPDCFNGDCKKLMSNAIPTRQLGTSEIPRLKTKRMMYGQKIMDLLKKNLSTESESINLINSKIDLTDSHQESHVDLFSVDDVSLHDEAITLAPSKVINDEEQFELMEIADGSGKDGNFTIVLPEIHSQPAKLVTYKRAQERLSVRKIESKELRGTIDLSESSEPLSESVLQSYRNEFYASMKNQLAQKMCTKLDLTDIIKSTIDKEDFHFDSEIEMKGTGTGKCWISNGMSLMKLPFTKKFNLEEFDFSREHFFYWDTIERSYTFLNNIIEAAKRGENINGRLMSHLLKEPLEEGGQWDMFANIINKHGVMPKKFFSKSFSSESSGRMKALLKYKLRQFSKDLCLLVSSSSDFSSQLQSQMNDIYNIVGICLGIPPEKFTWEYYDKSKKYFSVGPITGFEFYEKYVKPCFNVDDKVCLVTDPRSSSQFGKAYTIDCLGNVVGGRSVFYNNQPVEILMDLVTKSLKAGEAVWFGCEFTERLSLKNLHEIEDFQMPDYQLLFNVDLIKGLSKAERLSYRESLNKHAMIFTGVTTNDEGIAIRFQVQHLNKIFVMTSDWFKEYIHQIVVDKNHVPDEILKVFKMIPSILPAWDPLAEMIK